MTATPTRAQRRTLTPKPAATRWSLEFAARRVYALAAGGMSVPEIRLRFPVPADWPDDSTMLLLQCGRGALGVDAVKGGGSNQIKRTTRGETVHEVVWAARAKLD